MDIFHKVRWITICYSSLAPLYSILPATERAEFDQNKASATAVPNSVDRIKFDFSTAVARRLKPSRATAV